jgi:hypothetical protein
LTSVVENRTIAVPVISLSFLLVAGQGILDGEGMNAVGY